MSSLHGLFLSLLCDLFRSFIYPSLPTSKPIVGGRPSICRGWGYPSDSPLHYHRYYCAYLSNLLARLGSLPVAVEAELSSVDADSPISSPPFLYKIADFNLQQSSR